MAILKNNQNFGNKHFSSRNNHFWLTFDNGITLSTIFGYCSYSENRYGDESIQIKDRFDVRYESDNAEIAIINPEGDFITKKYKDDGDGVLGYVSFDEWLKIVDWCKNYKKEVEK